MIKSVIFIEVYWIIAWFFVFCEYLEKNFY